MNNKIGNPYQHNVDIIKGFFRRPIVLALAILMTVSTLLSMFSGLFLVSGEIYNSEVLSRMPAQFTEMFEKSTDSVSLPATSILITVAIFLFYFFSRSQSKSLKVPSKIFKIVTLVEMSLVFVLFGVLIVAAAIFLAFGFDVYDSALSSILMSSADSYFGMPTDMRYQLFVIICTTILVTLILCGAFAGWFATMQYRFAKSIDDSMSGINLYKKGAMAYGICSIVIGGCPVISVSSLFTVFSPLFATFMLLIVLIGAATNIIMGIVAIKYASYIKNISINFSTEPVYVPEEMDDFEEAMPFGNIHGVTSHMDDDNPYAQTTPESANSYCTKCGNSVTTEDLFCNKCGNKLK